MGEREGKSSVNEPAVAAPAPEPRLYRFSYGSNGGDLYDGKRGQRGLLVSLNDYDALARRVAELEEQSKFWGGPALDGLAEKAMQEQNRAEAAEALLEAVEDRWTIYSQRMEEKLAAAEAAVADANEHRLLCEAVLKESGRKNKELTEKLTAAQRDAERMREALHMSRRVLLHWQQLYARMEHKTNTFTRKSLDYNLPPSEHVTVLEDIDAALAEKP